MSLKRRKRRAPVVSAFYASTIYWQLESRSIGFDPYVRKFTNDMLITIVPVSSAA